MPELPEVEVLRRSLEPRLLGARIRAVEVRDGRLREPVDAAALARAARGRRVLALRRRSKYLLIDLEGGSTLVLHLGMTGQVTVVARREPAAPHEHVVFRLAGGERLRFVDPRRFGLVLALPTATIEEDAHFSQLGVEPLVESGDVREAPVAPATPVRALTGGLLRAAARGRRGPVKPFLMDARVVVGVGNIYASEALFEAGIDPRRSVARISAPRWERLAAAVRTVLARAIAQGGTSISDFVDGEGKAGYFQVSLAVYDREGEPCARCGAAIRRVVQAGRSTYWCPRCQR